MYKDPLLQDTIYHIYNRGNNHESIFKEHKNYVHFLNLWKKHIHPIANSFVYNLLPNHFHFLIRTLDIEEKKIHQSFSNFFNSYSKSINKSYTRTGSLFQERFGRKIIDTDDYFTNIIWYIHSNAQKHQIIKDFAEYPYSSYHSILSEKPTLLCRDQVLEWFGNREQYIKFHQENRSELGGYLDTLEF